MTVKREEKGCKRDCLEEREGAVTVIVNSFSVYLNGDDQKLVLVMLAVLQTSSISNCSTRPMILPKQVHEDSVHFG